MILSIYLLILGRSVLTQVVLKRPLQHHCAVNCFASYQLVPCSLVWRLFETKCETKPIQYVASKTINFRVRVCFVVGICLKMYTYAKDSEWFWFWHLHMIFELISVFLKYKSQNYQLLYLLKENSLKSEWNSDCITVINRKIVSCLHAAAA